MRLERTRGNINYLVRALDDRKPPKIGQLVAYTGGQDDEYTFAPKVCEVVEVTKGVNGVFRLLEIGAFDPFEVDKGCCAVFDFKEWLAFTTGYLNASARAYREEHEITKGKLNLLKDIMENQGVRVVTEEQAKALGLPGKK
jgi:hypothetical protein